jgi:hypothetical protein
MRRKKVDFRDEIKTQKKILKETYDKLFLIEMEMKMAQKNLEWCEREIQNKQRKAEIDMEML